MRISLTLVAAVTVGLVAASTGLAAPPEALTIQDDLNCKMYGIAGGILAQGRDEGKSVEDSMEVAKSSLEVLVTPTELERLSVVFAVDRLQPLSGLIFGSKDINAKTFLYALPYFCLAGKIANVTEAGTKAYFEKAKACQREFPLNRESLKLDVLDEPSKRLQACIGQHVTMLGELKEEYR